MRNELLVSPPQGAWGGRTRGPIALAAGLAAITLAPTARAADYRPIAVVPSAIVRLFEDPQGPKARLADGREYLLMTLPDDLKERLLIDVGKPPVRVPLPAFPFPWPIFPDSVDNRQYQGPIRDQGGRGTCVSFSTTAAVEGRYRRVNPAAYAGLDLSEQWANHMQKMVSLSADLQPDAADREDQIGAWGGSGNHYLMRVLKKYGEPLESVMAYNPDGSYGPATDPSDPKWTLQRTTDNFNLDPGVLPLSALETARYRPKAVTELTYDQARDTSNLETLVALGYDVVFDIALASSAHQNSDYVWTPDDDAKPGGGHSMLIVGYNRSKQYFIVRNSWGYDTSCHDYGYVRMSYDYLRKLTYSGSFVTAVADPGADDAHARLYIGRWKMNHDGWPGTLDIYRLPGLFQSSELKGQNDDRIGTYYGWDGKAYRVNGYFSGRQLVFFINFSSPDSPYGSLAGTRFAADLFSWDDQNMAGLEVQDGQTYSFMATKEPFPAHSAASSPASFRDAHLGHWKMNHDGWRGELYLYAGGSPDAIVGNYLDRDGKWHSVQGSISGRNFRFRIWFDGYGWQQFSGYLYSWDKGLMAGITWWNGAEFGFQAFRQADPIRVPIPIRVPVRTVLQ